METAPRAMERIDDATQKRLSLLMGRNNEGTLTAEERRELKELGAQAERVSLENVRKFAKAR